MLGLVAGVTGASALIVSLGLNKIADLVEQAIMNSPNTLTMLKDLTPVSAFPVGGLAFVFSDLIGSVYLARRVWVITHLQEDVLA